MKKRLSIIALCFGLVAVFMPLTIFGAEDKLDMDLEYVASDDAGISQNDLIEIPDVALQEEELIRLDTPDNLRWSDYTAVWDPVDHADHYYVRIAITENENSYTETGITTTDTEYDMTSYLRRLITGRGFSDGAKLKAFFSVTACPDTYSVYVDSEQSDRSPYLEGIDIQLNKLSTPENLHNEGSVLYWDAVENAEEYSLSIGVTENGGTSSWTGVSTASVQYDLSSFVRRLMRSAGYLNSDTATVMVELKAVGGRNTDFTNSDAASFSSIVSDLGLNIKLTRLEAPANVIWDGAVLKWDAVKDASEYYLEIAVSEKGSNSSTVTGRSTKKTQFDCAEIITQLRGSRGITNTENLIVKCKVRAVAEQDADFADSVYSEEIPMTNVPDLTPRTVSISNANITGLKSAYSYTGKKLVPTVTVSLGSSPLVKDTDYTISYSANTNVGTAQIVIKGKGKYTGTIKKTFVIKKAKNTLVAKNKTVTYKSSVIRKKNQLLTAKKAFDVSKNQGKITYTISSVNKTKYRKYFAVNSKTGKVTIKKGLGKGTYKVNVKISAAGNDNYKKMTKTVTLTVKVN